ncbi:DUF3298 and DUF4163 domain-containing protein [Dyadobacter sp. CY261]|uniref:DUF3298 and DUF4163 domain-containing protein n=1 Tax=Dyadobacter sp. CY261 TaxID=2907203 RepID=UPI001F28A32C|nr:DUF3298 and DUF4163 domain-containing protein [Dyadobacter sp. CY261]MCF0073061.1 DUF3298 and DUF4163 domain-containing protein [Dyadobacter sp. CY261]
MILRQLAALSLGTLLFWACNQSSKKEGADARVGFQKGEIKKEDYGSCDTAAHKGVTVLVSLWQPTDSSAVASKIRQILTEKTIKRLNSYGDSASIAANPGASGSVKAAFDVFEKNYNDFKEDFPDAPGCWEVELHGDTVMITSKMLFYQLDHYSFTGGAHPNSFTSFHAFDAKTGEEVEMKSFVQDSVALLSLVEKKFRELGKLTPEVDLEDEGYFLVDHKFFIPANYVFTQEGVLFYYNPYEIAAYVRGAIDFTIPYEDLKGIIRKDAAF